jgi:hypothetical protein
MPKIHLITFADGSPEYHAAGKRLIKQSLLFPQIDIRKVFSSADLGAEYHKILKSEITSAKVGKSFKRNENKYKTPKNVEKSVLVGKAI